MYGDYVRRKVKMLVAQACLTLCDPMDCEVPGSSVHEFSRQDLEKSNFSLTLIILPPKHFSIPTKIKLLISSQKKRGEKQTNLHPFLNALRAD